MIKKKVTYRGGGEGYTPVTTACPQGRRGLKPPVSYIRLECELMIKKIKKKYLRYATTNYQKSTIIIDTVKNYRSCVLGVWNTLQFVYQD